MEVIFSHVPNADRLGTETLPELISYLTDEKQKTISKQVDNLAKVNAAILRLNERSTEVFRERLQRELAQRESELTAHDAGKPEEVPEPSQDFEQLTAVEAIKQELADLVKRTEDLDEQMASAQEALGAATLQVAAADRLLTRISNLEKQLEMFRIESAGDADVLEIDLETIVKWDIHPGPILAVREAALKRGDSLRNSLDVDNPESLVMRRDAVAVSIEATRRKLDEPNRRRQEYLQALARWKRQRAQIEGTSEVANSVNGLKAKLTALEDIPQQIKDRERQRTELVGQIYQQKQELLADYKRLHSSVQDFIDRHPVSQQHGGLQFSAAITEDDFASRFLGMIHQGKKGTFQGEKDGRDRVEEMLGHAEFSTQSGVEAFLGKVHECLTTDKRDGKNASVRLEDQLKQGHTPADVINFLYSLDYLKPLFELKWQGKPLDQLSPGERGSLLLIFFLLIDKRDVPLLIDQPEENLDNQTIATMLVPAIKFSKERRQIIMVTHNPNLAVVCDTDQVIHAQLEKMAGNRVTYTSGAIEDPTITQLIVDVLEGTKPAFDLRDAKYELLEH